MNSQFKKLCHTSAVKYDRSLTWENPISLEFVSIILNVDQQAKALKKTDKTTSWSLLSPADFYVPRTHFVCRMFVCSSMSQNHW